MSDPLLTEDPLWIASPVSWRDACFSLPAVRALSEHHAVHLLCPDEQQSFWDAAAVGETQSYDATDRPRTLAAQLPEIAQCLLWEDGTAAKAIAHAKVPNRIGLPRESLAKRLNRLITITRQPGPASHRVRLFLDTAEQLAAGPFESRHFDPIKTGVTRQAGSVLLAPDSDFGDHYQWPTDRWITLIKELSLNGSHVRIHGNGPAASALAEATGFEVIRNPSPESLAAFEKCLAADSSLPHLAGAFGVSCAVLFGPGDPDRTRPLGKKHRSIRTKVECSPCLLDACPLDLRCQNELKLETVRDEVRTFLLETA